MLIVIQKATVFSLENSLNNFRAIIQLILYVKLIYPDAKVKKMYKRPALWINADSIQ
jgi:hypothetical protein